MSMQKHVSGSRQKKQKIETTIGMAEDYSLKQKDSAKIGRVGSYTLAVLVDKSDTDEWKK